MFLQLSHARVDWEQGEPPIERLDRNGTVVAYPLERAQEAVQVDHAGRARQLPGVVELLVDRHAGDRVVDAK